jgi:hypothetical protein
LQLPTTENAWTRLSINVPGQYTEVAVF